MNHCKWSLLHSHGELLTINPKVSHDVLRYRRVREFMARHLTRETARRRVCAECQFETGQLDARESHAPGCSRAMGRPLSAAKGKP